MARKPKTDSAVPGAGTAMTDQEFLRYLEEGTERLLAEARRVGLTETDEIVLFMRDHLLT
jgi:hypothetical protein